MTSRPTLQRHALVRLRIPTPTAAQTQPAQATPRPPPSAGPIQRSPGRSGNRAGRGAREPWVLEPPYRGFRVQPARAGAGGLWLPLERTY